MQSESGDGDAWREEKLGVFRPHKTAFESYSDPPGGLEFLIFQLAPTLNRLCGHGAASPLVDQ